MKSLDACTITVIKNRYKKWLNRLPEDTCPKKWKRIQEFERSNRQKKKPSLKLRKKPNLKRTLISIEN